MNNKKKQHLINNEIKAREVRLTDIGIVSFNEALKLAETQNLDLVLMAPNAIFF